MHLERAQNQERGHSIRTLRPVYSSFFGSQRCGNGSNCMLEPFFDAGRREDVLRFLSLVR